MTPDEILVPSLSRSRDTAVADRVGPAIGACTVEHHLGLLHPFPIAVREQEPEGMGTAARPIADSLIVQPNQLPAIGAIDGSNARPNAISPTRTTESRKPREGLNERRSPNASPIAIATGPATDTSEWGCFVDPMAKKTITASAPQNASSGRSRVRSRRRAAPPSARA